MELREFKKIIDKADRHAGKCKVNVEFWVNDKPLDIKEIGQFGVIPDVVITLEPRRILILPDGGRVRRKK